MDESSVEARALKQEGEARAAISNSAVAEPPDPAGESAARENPPSFTDTILESWFDPRHQDPAIFRRYPIFDTDDVREQFAKVVRLSDRRQTAEGQR